MIDRMILTIIIFLGGIFLTFARRYKNRDSNAGYAIAGWTIFIILCLWFEECDFLTLK